MQAKYTLLTTSIKQRFDSLGVTYNGTPQTGGLVSGAPSTTATGYFYHSDHLGSSSLITDGSGNLMQHLEYVPFGEVFIDERNGSWSTPYKFNAKEQDEETGLYYYGARYYDSKSSVWLSVDPLAEKYPNVSSYVYCDDNPVKYIDPDGRQRMIAPPLGIIQYLSIAKTLEHTQGNQNARQIGYAMQHPFIANHVKNDLGVVAGNFQLNIGKAIGAPKNEEGTPQNAIRHTLWQALSARDLGSKNAERAANSHETTTNVDLRKRNFTGQNASDNADRTIDLLNNIIGRKIGEDNKDADNKTMAIRVIEEYHNNGLWTMSGNDKTGYTIQKTKLTDAQYKAAIQEINKKGNDGLNKKK